MPSKQIFSHTNHFRMKEPEVFFYGKVDILNTADGEYYDLTSGLWNVNYGYNCEHYKGIYENQYEQLHYYPNCFWSSTDITEKAAKIITEHYNMAGVYFGTSGSDAIRTAIYISKFYNNKTEILSHSKAYHGSDNITKLCDDIESTINENTAAVIIEPVMTTSGVIEYPKEKLLELVQLRNQYKFLIIFDETITGLGRTEIDKSIVPDIIIISKGLTNGIFPLSATMVSSELMNYIQTSNKIFDYGITMSGHPIGSALLLKSVELYHSTHDRRKQLEIDIVNKLTKVKFRNYGLLFGIEMKDGDIARKEVKKLRYIIRNYENTLIFAPMFISDIAKYQSFFDYIQSTALPDY